MRLTLTRVTLEDVGLIDKADIVFGPGLTVFTGETGSGKTMVIGGLGLGLGERASADIVRSNALRARMTLTFDLDDTARALFEQTGFPLDDGEDAIVEREIFATGKSQARCNGRVATAGQLRELLTHFVERVGQHDQQRLLDPREHLELVDRYGGPALREKREQVARSFTALQQLEHELTELLAEGARNTADREEAEEALAAIEAAAIAPDEDTTLRERRERLHHAEKIARSLQSVHEVLTDDDDAAVAQIGRSVQALREIERFDQEYAELASRLLSMQNELSDVSRSLARDLGEEVVHAHELEAIDTRLEKIERLKRRYGGSIGGIENAKERFRAIVMLRSDRERAVRDCKEHCRVAAEVLHEDGEALTTARQEAAMRLQTAVSAELTAVAMGSAHFEVRITPCERIGAMGAEQIEFLLAPTFGATLRPIVKVASGGELSRILLALTVVLAGDTGASIMIFDEIDAGIGGATATAVGERLYRLARNVQVLCVTHLAQLAAFGDAHFVVEKKTKKKLTQIDIRGITQHTDVVTEIARMLSGSDTTVAREHAADLLARRPAEIRD